MRAFILAAALLGAMPAFAQERAGCDKFKWPLERERALMAKPAGAASGATIAAPLASALKIALKPQAEAALPTPPERAPRLSPAFAGFVRMNAPPRAGTYRITVSANAWIDVVQDGGLLPAGEFSGVQGCEGLRKSVKFTLAATPFVIQLSGMPADTVIVTVTQD